MENLTEEKCLFEIKSGMYSEPLVTKGTAKTEGTRLVYTWTEKHNEQEKSNRHTREPSLRQARKRRTRRIFR